MSPAGPIDAEHKTLFTSIHQFTSELFSMPWKAISITKFVTSFEIKRRTTEFNSVTSNLRKQSNE